MGSKLDRQLWSKVHSKSLGSFTPGQFQSFLDAGVDPWISYEDGAGRSVSLLEGLCRADVVDRQMMLALWIKRVGNPDGTLGKPPALHCLPVPCSLNAIDKLVSAGASPLALNEKGYTPLEGLVGRLLYQADDTQWRAVELLRSYSKESYSSLRVLDKKGAPVDFLKVCLGNKGTHYLDDDELSTILANGNWDLEWKDGAHPASPWTREMLATQLNYCHDASIWTRAGLDWSGSCPDGMNLAHHILMTSGRFDEYGRQILPINSLCEALDRGVDFDYEGSLQWTPRQRINSITWSDQSGKMDKLLSRLKAARLEATTSPVLRSASARRI